MVKKLPITIEESPSPRALVIGIGVCVGYLCRSLEEKGCVVTYFESAEAAFNSLSEHYFFHYIFLFGQFSAVTRLLRTLNKDGKMLFVETDQKESLQTPPPHLRIARVGSLSKWQPKELTETLLDAIFAGNAQSIINKRREPPIQSISSPLPSLTMSFSRPSLPKKEEKIESSSTPRLTLQQPQPKNPSLKSQSIRVTKRMSAVGVVSLLFSISILFVLLFAAGLTWYAHTIKASFQRLKQDMTSAEWENVQQDLTVIRRQLAPLSLGNELLSKVGSIVSLPAFENAGMLIYTTDNLLETTQKTLSFFQNMRVSNSASDTLPKLTSSQMQQTTEAVNALALSLTETQNAVKKTNAPFFPKDTILSALAAWNQKVSAVKEVMPLSEKLLLVSSPKTYLILFQNPMELRPTGGFIGSFGLLTIKEGAISDLQIMDVYQADGQLKGHVDPPLPIRTIMGQPNWFLRDSNFDPDFARSALTASWFLQKELNITVDGVMGINLFVMQDLLRITGPLAVIDFPGEIISSENFFEKTHLASQTNFFPGSQQKKNYLNAVTKTLQLRLMGEHGAIWLDVLGTIKKALEQKNFLLYTNDESAQRYYQEKGWAGRMIQVGCAQPLPDAQATSQQECRGDFLSVVEANLGVNKANYAAEKTVTVDKRFSREGTVDTLVELVYTNGIIDEKLHGGTYTNYLRVFAPKGSSINTVAIANTPVPVSAITTEQYADDKVSFGFLVSVPVGQKRAVSISYTTPALLTQKTTGYQFFYQKQAGDKTSSLTLSFTVETPVVLMPLNFTGSLLGQGTRYVTDTSIDRIFAFSLSQR